MSTILVLSNSVTSSQNSQITSNFKQTDLNDDVNVYFGNNNYDAKFYTSNEGAILDLDNSITKINFENILSKSGNGLIENLYNQNLLEFNNVKNVSIKNTNYNSIVI